MSNLSHPGAEHAPPRRRLLAGAGMLGVPALLGGCVSDTRVGPAAVAGQRPDATVEMRSVQAAYIGSGTTGDGVLTFHGRRHPFSITGAGVGGMGASTIEAYGDVFNLRNPADFSGPYAQARTGFAVGSTGSGDLWLQNPAGVIMHLHARRTGLMLSMGADAMVITLR